MFIAMLADCEADKGLMITEQGYTKAAINRAHYGSTSLELDILNFKDLTGFQGLGGIVHKGKYGAVVSRPSGWILDGARREGFLATLFQRGLKFEDAFSSREFIYVDISDMRLVDLLNHQKKKTIDSYPDAVFENLKTVKRDTFNTCLREFSNMYPVRELTGFVEFEDFVFFAVLLTTKELSSKNIKKLESIMQSVIPISVSHVSR